MKLPNQSLPVIKEPSDAKYFHPIGGVNLSQDLLFQCQACCALGRTNCSDIPNCDCSNLNYF